jgi:hypothetical protein
MSNFQNKFVRKMPNPFLKYTEVPGEKGSLQLGDNSSGTLSFNSNALVTESGSSWFAPPGATRERLSDPEGVGGFLVKTNEILALYPPIPEYLPNTKGLVFIIPAVVLCASILRENMK